VVKEGTETLRFNDGFIGISKDGDTSVLFGKIESNRRIGFRRRFKFSYFIFDVVEIEFLELGVKMLLYLESSVLVNDKIITSKHIGKDFCSKYFTKLVLDGEVNDSKGSKLFELHIVFDLTDGNLLGVFVGIDDKSHWIREFWIGFDVTIGGNSVNDN